MAHNPKGKTIYLAQLKLRSDNVDGGGAIPEDIAQADFIISTGDKDGHGSIMTEQTLRNYTEDASRRVPFMLNHGVDMDLQIGSTIAATYDEAQKQVMATVEMLRDTDSTPEPMRVNEYIRRIEHGMYNSVSVGFRDAKETCNLDGKDIFWDGTNEPCEHLPKRFYDGKECTYDVDDAHLREVSLVPTGSNPNAKLLDTREWEENLMKFKKDGDPGTASTYDNINVTKANPESILERDGLKFRTGLINAAISAGIRAKEGFDEDAWKKRFATMEAEQITEQTKDWDTIGDTRWRKGGRKTTDYNGGNYNQSSISANAIVLPENVWN